LSLLEDDDFEDKPIPVKEDVEKLLGLSVSDDRMEVRISMELGPNCKPFELVEILRLLKNKKNHFWSQEGENSETHRFNQPELHTGQR